MNLKNKNIMDEYRVNKNDFISLGNVVSDLLRDIVKQSDIQVLTIEHRVKQEDSLAGKLELKGDKYKDLSDITDILGARIVCFLRMTWIALPNQLKALLRLTEKIPWTSGNCLTLVPLDIFRYITFVRCPLTINIPMQFAENGLKFKFAPPCSMHGLLCSTTWATRVNLMYPDRLSETIRA